MGIWCCRVDDSTFGFGVSCLRYIPTNPFTPNLHCFLKWGYPLGVLCCKQRPPPSGLNIGALFLSMRLTQCIDLLSSEFTSSEVLQVNFADKRGFWV